VEDNIKMDLVEIRCEDMRSGFVWHRTDPVAGCCEHGTETYDSFKK
jgi:hypothetical protein